MKNKILILCLGLLLCTGTLAAAYDETYEKAFKHFKKREYKSSVIFLESYATRNPDPAVYYMLGYAHYQLGNLDRSREFFNQTYLIDPEFTSDKIPVHAGLSEEEQTLVHSVLELSGTKKKMESYAGMIGSMLPQLQAGLTDEKQKSDMLFFVKDSYSSSRIYPPVIRTFSDRFKRDHIISVIRWLKSPAGQKSLGVEAAVSMPEMIRKAAAYRNEYDLMDENRKQLIRELEAALRAIELTVDIVSVSLFELLKGMQTVMFDSSLMNSQDIDVLVGKVRGVSRGQLTQDVLVSLAFVSRSMSDAELAEVVRFYRSPEGRWFSDTSSEAVSSAIGRASRDIGEKMGSFVLSRRVAL